MPPLLVSRRCAQSRSLFAAPLWRHSRCRAPPGITAVCFADAEYPSRVAFGYLSKLCEDFMQATGGRLAESTEDGCMDAAFPVPASAHPTTISLPPPPFCLPRAPHTPELASPPASREQDRSPISPAPAQAHPKLLTQFQDPGQADQLTKIMSELEQTKVVLHDTIEAALERGQKIDTCTSGSYELAQGHPSGPASWGHMWQKSKIFLSHAA